MEKQIAEIVINALGNPNFNTDAVFEAVKNAPQNGSLLAILNILPELEQIAKKQYLK